MQARYAVIGILCLKISGGETVVQDYGSQLHQFHTPKDYMQVRHPKSIVTNNIKQFNNPRLKHICQEMGISKTYSTPVHPQAEGQVETVNKKVKDNLQKNLEALEGAWVDELPLKLWKYHSTSRTAMGKTPLSLMFRTEAVIPAEVGMPSYRVEAFIDDRVKENDELELLDEAREEALVRMAA